MVAREARRQPSTATRTFSEFCRHPWRTHAHLLLLGSAWSSAAIHRGEIQAYGCGNGSCGFPILVLLLVQLSILFLLSDSSIADALVPPQESSSSSKERHQPALVQSTCNSTSFYDTCVATLAADPSSSTAEVPGLCAIAVSTAATSASGTASFLANASDAAATPEADRALLRTCAGKYAAARDALLAARVSLAEQDYDYAFVHVSAAAEYPSVCRTLFRRRQQQQHRPGSKYPAELAKREEALRRLCSITLDIISLLQVQ